MTEDDILQIEEQHIDDVRASSAELRVRVHGEKLFGGDAALEKAEEVRELRDALVEAGIARDAITLIGLSAHVTTGLFSKSSSAYYTLGVRVSDLACLTDAFDAIVSAKQATLLGIRWIHEPSAEVVGAWTERCARRARAVADRLSRALGTEIVGVARCRTELLGRERLEADVVHMLHVRSQATKRRSAGIGGALFEDQADGGGSTELAPTKRMGVRIELGFRLAG